MNFQYLTVLMPCHSLEEFVAERPEDESEQLLSAWSALWHPALVAAAGKMPGWAPAAAPPLEPAGHLCVLPPCCEDLLPAAWLSDAEHAGAQVIRRLGHRGQIVAAALDSLGPHAPAVEPALAADFLALGFCHLAVELLTRKLRYSSQLDEPAFSSQLLAAAQQACEGDTEAARRHLQSAFDLLHHAREYFFPVEPRLVDLTLLASTTLGPSLRQELASGRPLSLLASGQLIEEMARREPASLQALREALSGGRVTLLGGEYSEPELALLPPEAIGRNLRRGLDAYQRHLGARPLYFARRRFGLSPLLPQILEKFGFRGALHATLDDGRFPSGDANRVRWEGLDGTALEAVQRIPDDANRAQTFLRLPQRLVGAVGSDQAAIVVLAHWPAQAAPWYHDLDRIAPYGSVLGSFATMADCFQQTAAGWQDAAYTADQYRSPYLSQAVAAGQSDPLSRWVRYFQRLAVAEAADTLAVLASLAGGARAAQQAAEMPPHGNGDVDIDATDATSGKPAAEKPPHCNGGELLAAEDPLDLTTHEPRQASLDAAVGELAAALAGSQSAATRGVLLLNPLSFSRRIGLNVPDLPALPAVVDVPPLGFAWIAPGTPSAEVPSAPSKWSLFHRRPKEEPPLAFQQPVETLGKKSCGRRRRPADRPPQRVLHHRDRSAHRGHPLDFR